MANNDQNVVNNSVDDKMTEPLLRGEQNLADENGGSGDKTGSKDSLYMVYLSTFVAVCGSYSFGTGVINSHISYVQTNFLCNVNFHALFC